MAGRGFHGPSLTIQTPNENGKKRQQSHRRYRPLDAAIRTNPQRAALLMYSLPQIFGRMNRAELPV